MALTFVAPNSPNLGYTLFRALLPAACQVADLQSGKALTAQIVETIAALEQYGIICEVNAQNKSASQLVADLVAYYYQGAAKPQWFSQIVDHL